MKRLISERIDIIPFNHLKELDGLRAIAVLMVFFYHIWLISGVPKLILNNVDLSFIMVTGHAGVDLFYVLSGFLLFQLFAKSFHARKEWLNYLRI